MSPKRDNHNTITNKLFITASLALGIAVGLFQGHAQEYTAPRAALRQYAEHRMDDGYEGNDGRRVAPDSVIPARRTDHAGKDLFAVVRSLAHHASTRMDERSGE